MTTWVRRTTAFLAAVAVPAMLLVACGGGDAEPVAVADTARLEADPTEAADVVGPLSDFGWDAYRELAADAEANVVFSPHSIAVALAMTRAGAAGATASEMDAVLHIGAIDDPHSAINALDLAIESASGPVERPDGTTVDVTIAIANALWAQDGFGFEQSFLTTLGQNYGAGVRLVDYRNDHEAARQDINAWVGQETRDRIDELIAPGVLSAMTRLVLTNTVYLKAPWEHPFDDQATTPAPFTRLDGSSSTVALMSVSDSFGHSRLGDLQAIELPYAGGELSMLVLVPDAGAFEAVTARIDDAMIDEVIGSMRSTPVDLRFPRFDYTTAASMVGLLQSLGMELAFDPDRADFSAMTTEAPLVVSDVVHEAVITVDEAGTEAAAATAVVMDLTAAPAEPLQLTIDRPFVLLIRHVETGAPLFIGHVVDPAAGGL